MAPDARLIEADLRRSAKTPAIANNIASAIIIPSCSVGIFAAAGPMIIKVAVAPAPLLPPSFDVTALVTLF